MFFDPLYLLFMLPGFLLALWAQIKVKGNFNKYSKVPNSRGMTGAQAARRILTDNGISDVGVERVAGMLSDHYDPRSKTLRLSPEVHDSASVAAIGIAAHEVGHAIQHARQYQPLILRQTLAPVAMVGSNLAMFLLMIGFFMQSMGMVWLGILGFSAAVLFTLVTLPVEFNASNRAKELLPRMGLANQGEAVMVSKVLDAAALTYVAAAISAVLQLLYFLLRAGVLGGGSRDE
jgi:Zn-dependent membrane protease YugP